MDLSVVPYGHGDTVEKNGRVVDEPDKIRYRECLRNHAASIGGHANDGCGEFMPGGDDATPDSLKCAACGCHRNFHRKELAGCADHNHHPMILYKKKMGCFSPRPLPSQSQQHPALFQAANLGENRRSETPEGDVPGTKKRFRTKFTQEQKDKMQAFAEKLGWRLQKHDDVALQEFCMEIGIKRHVLKVWMHNNKNTLGKKETTNGV